jgi:hypothetical protein
MPITETANRVRQAEEVVRALLGGVAALDTSALLGAIVEQVEDPSIASLALWELLDRGELEFASRSRKQIRRAS